MELKTVSHYIIMVVVIALLAMVILRWKEIAHLESQKNICKASVYEHAASHIKGVDLSSSINCPTQNHTVPDGTPHEQKLYLAKRMAGCWEQFGEGKLRLFDHDDMYCVLCSWVEFSGDEVLHDFSEFLYTERMPGTEITFMDYLNGYETERAAQVIGDVTKDTVKDKPILPDKMYTIVFVYAKGDDNVRIASDMAVNVLQSAGTPLAVVGGVLLIAGGALTSFTGIAAPIGGAIIFVGQKVFMVGGVSAALESYFRTDLAPEHLAYVAFREYNQEELDQLGCRYLPARQRK
jgi:hypothetical protein